MQRKSIYQCIMSVLCVAPLLSISACGTDDMADVKFKMSHIETDTNALTLSAPTVFGIKLLAAYISEDISEERGDNIGKTGIIYLNPQCDDDISHCDISGGDAEDGSAMDKIVTDYFDLARTNDEVNEALNAQARSVEEGTYRYVRLEFCKYNSQDADNIKWQADGMDEPRTFQRNMCSVNSVKMDPPLQVSASHAVTVNLSYDLSQSITDTAEPPYDDCSTDDNTPPCVLLPEFVPSAE